jgi:hypothetical protein
MLQVLRDERLRLAIEAAAQYDYSQTDEKGDEVYKGIVQQHKARATKLLYDMRSTLSDFLLRYSNSVCGFIMQLMHSQEVCDVG